MAASASSWAAVSDEKVKDIHGEADSKSYLERLEKIPIYEYNYKGVDKGFKCIGPTAQDYHKQFGCSKDPLCIETHDLLGVALACIKELNARIKVLEAKLL